MSAGPAKLILASRSPRRAQLLREQGFEFEVRSPLIDDAELRRPPGCEPRTWVVGLAHLKASSLGSSANRAGSIVLGADTVVVKDREVIGQPQSAEEAREVIARLEAGSHEVLTGVALLGPERRMALVDQARVRVGAIGFEEISRYVASGAWRGKAGAYNLSERLADGWPITYEGDPGTIMGLPIRNLLPILERMGVRSIRPAREGERA